MVVLHPSCCALAFATAQADFGPFTVGLPQIGAVSGNVPSPLALIAQHCIDMTCHDLWSDHDWYACWPTMGVQGQLQGTAKMSRGWGVKRNSCHLL